MNLRSFDVILAGNQLTTLVAGVELARAGRKVCLVNPTPSWGGHFTRLTIQGETFDPGAVSHEFTAFNRSGAANPLEYDSRKRSDVGRFLGLIEAYTRSHLELHRMPMPATVYDGAVHEDIVMSNRLGLVKHPRLAPDARKELCHILAGPPSDLHTRRKKEDILFAKRSYHDVSEANHGTTLHRELFEPMFFKMSNIPSARLLALYHRIAWLPLYYPETLASQFGESPQELQETYFCYPRAGWIGAFGETLLEAAHSAGATILRSGITCAQGETGSLASLRLSDDEEITASRLVWSLGHESLLRWAGETTPEPLERWSAMLIFAKVPRSKLRRDFSVLYVPDRDVLFYRACNQSTCAGSSEDLARVVVEVNPDYAKSRGLENADTVIPRVLWDLTRLGIVTAPEDIRIWGHRILGQVLLLPSAENWRRLEKERDVLTSAYPGFVFTRNVESFFTDTLNDQIIKGLKIAAQFRST
jgi:hypothetical protein